MKLPKHPRTDVPAGTHSLFFRRLTDTDLPLLHRLHSSEVVHRYLVQSVAHNEAQTQVFLDKIQAHYRQYGYGKWAIIERQSGSWIGWAGLQFEERTFAQQQYCCYISYHLLPDYWQKGYATQAAQACVRYGFEQLSLPFIAALTRCDNTVSQRILHKLGFDALHPFELSCHKMMWWRLANKRDFLGTKKIP